VRVETDPRFRRRQLIGRSPPLCFFGAQSAISSANVKKKSQRFLRAVIEKFGTPEDVVSDSAAKKATLVASAWALLLAARKRLLQKEYSLEVFEMSEDEEKDDDEEGGGESEDYIEDLTGDPQYYIRVLLCKTEKFSESRKFQKRPPIGIEVVYDENSDYIEAAGARLGCG
jgi:hypothetical protein